MLQHPLSLDPATFNRSGPGRLVGEASRAATGLPTRSTVHRMPMMPLLAVLCAAPVEVLVVLPADARDAAVKSAPGRTFVDASGLYEYLLAPSGLFDFQDFEGFTAAPVAGWPNGLNDVWRTGLASCAEVAGPPPWRESLPGSRCCGRRLGRFLWDRYLASLKATRVLVVERHESPTRDIVVRGTRWIPDAPDELVVEKTSPPGSAGLVAEVMAGLLATEGPLTPRATVNTLFTPEPADLWARGEPPTAPLVLKKRCDTLPKELAFDAQTATAKALGSRWAAAARGTGPSLKCSLRYSSHAELPEGLLGSPTVVTTVLRCGETTVATELATVALPGTTPLEVVSKRLAEALVARLCR